MSAYNDLTEGLGASGQAGWFSLTNSEGGVRVYMKSYGIEMTTERFGATYFVAADRP